MKENLKLGGTLLAITAIAGLILAFAFDITRAPINARKAEEQAAAMRVVLEQGEEFTLVEDKSSEDILEAYEAKTSGKTSGYVFKTKTSGYGGEIMMLVGIDADSKVSGIEILSLSETPGLGSKIKDDPSFGAQYVGKPAEGKLALGSDITAISGATISSGAVNTAVNNVIEFYNAEILGNEVAGEAPLDENSPMLAEVLEAGSFTVSTVAPTDEVLAIFEADNGGYVLNVTSEGYAGTIETLVGITADGTVSGIKVHKHNETPGLGANAQDDPAFAESFKGLATDGEIAITDIDAISEATITSKAVVTGVNNAVDFFNTNLKGAK